MPRSSSTFGGLGVSPRGLFRFFSRKSAQETAPVVNDGAAMTATAAPAATPAIPPSSTETGAAPSAVEAQSPANDMPGSTEMVPASTETAPMAEASVAPTPPSSASVASTQPPITIDALLQETRRFPPPPAFLPHPTIPAPTAHPLAP